MTYTIETLRTVNGPRYYIRRPDGKRFQAGFARKETAQERIRLLELMDAIKAERQQSQSREVRP